MTTLEMISLKKTTPEQIGKVFSKIFKEQELCYASSEQKKMLVIRGRAEAVKLAILIAEKLDQ